MKWTFGICLGSTAYLKPLVDSICNQEDIGVSDYELVLVGQRSKEAVDILQDKANMGVRILFVDFDESQKPAWITRKKNIITQVASNENICYTHDYVGLCKGWYKGYKSFGDNWDVCMNPIRRIDGRRFRDWVIPQQWWGDPKFVDYHDSSFVSQMYISGTYWCGKKSFMHKNPLDENRCWGHGEDIEWSARCRKYWNYKLNNLSVVKLLKEKIFNGLVDYAPHPDTDPNKDFVIP
jgi:hypothetical protein